MATMTDEERKARNQGPSVSTVIPAPAPPPDPQAGQAAFGVYPPAGARMPQPAPALNSPLVNQIPASGTVQPPAGARPRPTYTVDVGAAMPSTAATLRGSGADASAAIDSGNYGAAAGHVVRGTAALIPAIADDLTRGRRAPLGGNLLTGAANALYTAATGQNELPGLPALTMPSFGASAATAAPVATNPNAQDQRLARPGASITTPETLAPALGATPPGAPATGPAKQPYSGGAISKKITNAGTGYLSGNPDGTYTWVENPELMQGLAQGAGKGRNYGDPAIKGNKPMSDLGPAAYPTRVDPNLAPDKQVFLDRDGNDPVAKGIRQQQEAQRAAIDIAAGAAAAAGGGNKTRSANFHAALGAAGTNNAAGNQVQLADAQSRERTATAQIAAGAPKAAADTAHATAQAAGIQSAQSAIAAHAAAVKSGNAAEIARTEAIVRAHQGRYDNTPDLYGTNVIPGSNDPINPRSGSVVITNKRDGTHQMVSADEGKKPAYVTGQVYRDAKGNSAQWDGTKFVPTK